MYSVIVSSTYHIQKKYIEKMLKNDMFKDVNIYRLLGYNVFKVNFCVIPFQNTRHIRLKSSRVVAPPD